MELKTGVERAIPRSLAKAWHQLGNETMAARPRYQPPGQYYWFDKKCKSFNSHRTYTFYRTSSLGHVAHTSDVHAGQDCQPGQGQQRCPRAYLAWRVAEVDREEFWDVVDRISRVLHPRHMAASNRMAPLHRTHRWFAGGCLNFLIRQKGLLLRGRRSGHVNV